MKSSRVLWGGLALALAFGGSLAPAAFAQGNAAKPAATLPAGVPVTVGVVDEDKLASSFKEYASAVDALDKRAGELDTKIPAREFLAAEESKTFDALVVKPSLNPTEKTQLDGLVKTGLDKRAEYMTLVGKAVRSEAEAQRMKALNETMAGNQDGVRKLSATLLGNIRAEQSALDKKYTDKANDVIGLVAADKKLIVILRKNALIWWANPIDITDDVLKRLNS